MGLPWARVQLDSEIEVVAAGGGPNFFVRRREKRGLVLVERACRRGTFGVDESPEGVCVKEVVAGRSAWG